MSFQSTFFFFFSFFAKSSSTLDKIRQRHEGKTKAASVSDSLPGDRAAIHSQSNTNGLRPDRCACAPQLTPPVPARNATLVAHTIHCFPSLKEAEKTNQVEFQVPTLAVCYSYFPSIASRQQLCSSSFYCAPWLWPSDPKSPRKMMSWC